MKTERNINERIKEVVKIFEEMDLETIKAYKWMIMVLIVADIFGFWWFLGLKQLAVAVLLVLVGFLTIFIIQERRRLEKMPEDEEEEDEDKKEDEDKPKEEKEKKTEKEEEPLFGGLPNIDEYNERMEKAYGTL